MKRLRKIWILGGLFCASNVLSHESPEFFFLIDLDANKNAVEDLIEHYPDIAGVLIASSSLSMAEWTEDGRLFRYGPQHNLRSNSSMKSSPQLVRTMVAEQQLAPTHTSLGERVPQGPYSVQVDWHAMRSDDDLKIDATAQLVEHNTSDMTRFDVVEAMSVARLSLALIQPEAHEVFLPHNPSTDPVYVGIYKILSINDTSVPDTETR